jgi:hypothetical protein
MRRPELNEVAIGTTIFDTGKPSINITMNQGQWDGFLQAAYDAGYNLIELDENENPVRIYKKSLE